MENKKVIAIIEGNGIITINGAHNVYGKNQGGDFKIIGEVYEDSNGKKYLQMVPFELKDIFKPEDIKELSIGCMAYSVKSNGE